MKSRHRRDPMIMLGWKDWFNFKCRSLGDTRNFGDSHSFCLEWPPDMMTTTTMRLRINRKNSEELNTFLLPVQWSSFPPWLPWPTCFHAQITPTVALKCTTAITTSTQIIDLMFPSFICISHTFNTLENDKPNPLRWPQSHSPVHNIHASYISGRTRFQHSHFGIGQNSLEQSRFDRIDKFDLKNPLRVSSLDSFVGLIHAFHLESTHHHAC